MPELPVVFEVGSLIAIVAILLADLLIVARRPHVPTLRSQRRGWASTWGSRWSSRS